MRSSLCPIKGSESGTGGCGHDEYAFQRHRTGILPSANSRCQQGVAGTVDGTGDARGHRLSTSKDFPQSRSFRRPNPTRLLTQRGLLNRERESLGEK